MEHYRLYLCRLHTADNPINGENMKNKIIYTSAALFSTFLLVLMLIYRSEAAAGVKSALSQAAESVIPSLFIFIALSNIISSLDLLEPLYSKIPAEKLFSMDRSSSQAVFCGLLCGFPIGAVVVNTLYTGGKIKKSEAERLLALSSCPSPAFLIGAVGGYYSSTAYGAGLYATSVLSCLLFGVITRVKKSAHAPAENGKMAVGKVSFTQAVCESVNKAGVTFLTITAYITFFSVMREVVSAMLPYTAVRDLTSALFEFSGGAYYGSTVGGLRGYCITGFAIGFSSLSIFMQTSNSAPSLSLKPFLCSKLMSAALCTAFSAVYWYLSGRNTAPSAANPVFSLAEPVILPLAIIAAAAVISGFALKRSCTSKNKLSH